MVLLPLISKAAIQVARSIWGGIARRRRRANATLVLRAWWDDNSGGTIPAAFKHVMRVTVHTLEKRPVPGFVLENHSWISQYVRATHPGHDSRIELADGIWATFGFKETSYKNKNDDYVLRHDFHIEINSTDGSLVAVTDFLEHCEEEYNALDPRLKSLQIFRVAYVFRSTGMSMEYSRKQFLSTKRFEDNMFGHRDIVEKVRLFQDSEELYRRLGKPYTMGLLFHGRPGCGKTSAIKALAALTGRHIVLVPTYEVESVEQLRKVFFDEHLCDLRVPLAKRLYVFEDIDCGHWEDVVRARTANVRMGENHDGKRDREQHVGKDVGGRRFTLGDLLEILDGLVEQSGRMLVMTTNRVDHLDAALLRPGRVDMCVEFREMAREDVRSMYALWFGAPMPEDVYAALPDRALTQAQLGNLFMQHFDDRDALHRALAVDDRPTSPPIGLGQ